MPPERVGHVAEARCVRRRTRAEGGREVTEQPRPTEAAAADDDAVAARLGHHPQGVVRAPDVAVAEHRHLRHRLLQPRDRAPVGGAGVEVRRGAGVQRDGGDPCPGGDTSGLQVGEVIGVDALPHLHRQRQRARGAHRPLDDVAEQVELPRQCRTAALAGHLRHRAPEVQVDVVGPVLLAQHGDGRLDRRGIDAVQLDGPGRLRGVEADEPHRLPRPLHEGAAGDHLAHVQARAVLAAQAPVGGVRDARHGCEHDGDVEVERPDAEGGRGRECRGHAPILARRTDTPRPGGARLLVCPAAADAPARGGSSAAAGLTRVATWGASGCAARHRTVGRRPHRGGRGQGRVQRLPGGDGAAPGTGLDLGRVAI